MGNLLIILTLFLLCPALTIGQTLSPVGIWKSIEDGTGRKKALIQIFKKDGKFFAKIAKLLDVKNPDARCNKCPGDKEGQPVEGLVFIENLKAGNQPEYWKDGTLINPDNGRTYNCSMWFENNNPDTLHVRAYHWTGLYRTQTWYRLNKEFVKK